MSNYVRKGATGTDRRQSRRSGQKYTHRSRSEDSYGSRYDYSHRKSYPGSNGNRDSRNPRSKYDTIGKVAIAVGVMQVVAGVLRLLHAKKSAERDREYDRRRRQDFDRAKMRRRREEEKREQFEREAGDHHDEDERERMPRRIGYLPADRSRSRSRPRGDPQLPGLSHLSTQWSKSDSEDERI